MTTLSEAPSGSRTWDRNTAAGRWYGLGRWYAMFPAAFARDAVLALSRAGETVLDPFCGRGNAPFAATVFGRSSIGIDIHPLAWLWTGAKLHPEPSVDRLLDRLGEVVRATRKADRRARTRFERMAWAPEVRAFLRAARRELDWQESITDRTLMAFVALHAQDKIGAGLSNQLSPTVAYSPSYAVDWWTRKGFLDPPAVDPTSFLTDRIMRRYKHGIPEMASGTALLGDARELLRTASPLGASLLITSPPYRGVTDYWNDHWIRLWLLGYDFRKDWKRSARHTGKDEYRALLAAVFREARRHLTRGAAVLVRCDQRKETATICAEALADAWPRRRIFVRATEAPYDGVSAEHGRGGSKARELDLLLPGNRGRRWTSNCGFRPGRDLLSLA
ncbi:MAG: DNA methyltransferase [Chloroflexi bacterium]|nr:DNA methyltransferase [Chloroflexota bacterium]